MLDKSPYEAMIKQLSTAISNYRATKGADLKLAYAMAEVWGNPDDKWDGTMVIEAASNMLDHLMALRTLHEVTIDQRPYHLAVRDYDEDKEEMDIA